MKDQDHISYYCFNKACPVSVYNRELTEVTDLPFTERTLSHEHHCHHCHGKLVSVVDIELRQAMSKKTKMPVLPRFAYKY